MINTCYVTSQLQFTYDIPLNSEIPDFEQIPQAMI